MTQTQAQEQLDEILPDPAIRDILLSIFAESIRHIRSRKPEWCLVLRKGKHLRLFAGRLIVLTLGHDEAWVTTDPEVQSIDWSSLRSWRWDERSYPAYRRRPSRNGYYSPRMDERGEWNEIRRSHHHYLDNWLNSGTAPNHRSILKHEPEIVEYIETTIGNSAKPLPDGTETRIGRSPFDPQVIADARTRALAPIVQRPGQSEFRKALLRAYDSTCCFSGCKIQQVLEAAHISPYQGVETDDVRNGLLLRADLHILFDEGLLIVETAAMTIVAAASLAGSIYAELDGKTIRLPRDKHDWPDKGALNQHRNEFPSTCSTSQSVSCSQTAGASF